MIQFEGNTTPKKEEELPFWAKLLIVGVVSFGVSSCVNVQSKLSNIDSDLFSMRLKINRMEETLKDQTYILESIKRDIND